MFVVITWLWRPASQTLTAGLSSIAPNFPALAFRTCMWSGDSLGNAVSSRFRRLMFRDLPRWWRKPCLNCEELSQYFLHQFQISGEVAGCVWYLQVENIAAWEAPNEGGIGEPAVPPD